MNPFEEPFAEAVRAAASGEGRQVITLGRTVVCDCCNTDLTDDSRSGGFVFDGFGGLWAAGPCCAAREEARLHAAGAGDLIRGYCQPGVPFADWLRALHGEDASITVTPRRTP